MTVTLGGGALATVDLIVAQGATNRYQFRYSTGEPGYPVPVDLTGWTARAQLRRSLNSATAVYTSDPSSFTLDADGTVTWTISYTATQGSLWDGYDDGVYDLELTSPSGERVRLAGGRWTVSHDVTRDDA